MLFPTIEFFLFFTVVLILNWVLKKFPFLWRLFLVSISFFFYFLWDVKFLLVLICSIVANYIFGLLIFKNFYNSRKFFLLSSLSFNLFILSLFKYYDFFRVSLETLFSKVHLPFSLPVINVALPIGLSFYIFKILSFHFEILQGKIIRYPSFLDFSVFISFFPYLLSGPIVRASEFLPQLGDGGKKKIENFSKYLTFIIVGLIKKLIFASWLSLELVDDVFAVPENHSFLAIFLAVISYSLVIYFDFSSYSDLAIGFAGLLGFETPINFNYPYLASNLKEFWRRWHITLSNWARDYIYIPLGGNQKGNVRKYLNLFLVMLMIGFWHGANWNFILWGLFHGFGLIFTHFLNDRKIIIFSQRIIPAFLTFSFVSFGWILFGAKNLENGIGILKNLLFAQAIVEPIKLYLIFLILIGFLFLALERRIFGGLILIQEKIPSPILLPCLIFIFLLIYKLSPDTVPFFIYFKF